MKKSLSLLLAACMLFGMLSVTAFAQENTQSVDAQQYVLFGGNQWLVLDGEKDNTGAEGMFLLSADVVQSGIAFNASGLSNAWAGSAAQAWAADYAAGFSAEELAAIKTVSKTDAQDEQWIASALDNEKVFFLSAQEAQTYVEDMAAGKGWWLRSGYNTQENTLFAGAVSDVGLIGTPHVAAKYDARPALNLDKSKIAVLKAVDENTLKVALLDESRSFTASAEVKQNSVDVTYAGANTGSNEFVTAMICDAEGNCVYTADVAANSASGTASVAIPTGLAGAYTLYVFSEQRNEGNATNYASAPVSFPLNLKDALGEVISWNLLLGDHLTLQFHVDVTGAEAAQITVGGKTVIQNVAQAEKDENGYCVFTADVAAAQMTEQVKVQLIAGENKGEERSYTVREYADTILADKTKEDCHELVKQMLNYGAAAQLYFGVNTSDLANAGIQVSSAQVPTENSGLEISGSTAGVNIYGATLSLKAKLAVRYYFTVSGDINDHSFTVGGQAYTPVKSAEGVYYIEVSGITPQNMDQAITVSVNEQLHITYSPMTYMVRMSVKGSEAVQDLVSAMYGYHLAAKDYVM